MSADNSTSLWEVRPESVNLRSQNEWPTGNFAKSQRRIDFAFVVLVDALWCVRSDCYVLVRRASQLQQSRSEGVSVATISFGGCLGCDDLVRRASCLLLLNATALLLRS